MRGIVKSLGLLTVLLSAPVSATSFICNTPILGVDMDVNGTVYLSTSYGVHAVCSQTLAFGYGAAGYASCSSWYAAFLTAKSSNRSVDLYYDTTNSYNTGLTVGACTAANFGSWTFHPAYNVMLN